jgi:CDP-diacylglycerol---serine O-phosphatidyltransferase
MNEAKVPHLGMVRELRVADWMTLANGAAGTGAIFAFIDLAVTGRYAALSIGAGLLFVALVFDVLDGSIARRMKKTSAVGRELDSLSDVISFGVAPAVLGYAIGLRHALDLVVLILFVSCGISRLARFNVTAASRSDENGKVRFFEGLPIPSSLLVAATCATLTAFRVGGQGVPGGEIALGPLSVHTLSLLYLAHGFAMVSRTIRIPKP